MEKIDRSFKLKTIEKTIKNKIKNWLNSITDEELREEVKNHYIVTGGAITNMLLGELPNDYDIYLDNNEIAVKLVGYYIKTFEKTDKISDIKAEIKEGRIHIMIKSSGILSDDIENDGYQYFEMLGSNEISKYLENFDKIKFNENSDKYKVVHITSNAISLSNDIQIITRFVGDAAEIHKNFDFVHTTNYYTEKDGLLLNMDAVVSTITKELRYVGSRYPIFSLFRIRKFLKREWTITAAEMFKISWDVNQLNLEKPDVLQEQLVGVDAAYFEEVLSILRKDVQSGKTLDRTYLFELLARVSDSE
jgi:hypothetical protein